ncbi:3'(2'),5'-bisphosphate nucleotidase CysQ family protein [Megalodesulfovibrio gigas]|uniref:3'(2'),5'-bisphosphate nucleotidase CysQ n=1 Tax=Megalodesulfovibrio gigas (strain ATCC 19364 / DSM 1382 / NCIMB 9332 / VKM B-1759) TaxID=1121448 RepID=T2GBV1_MEGG1|nr:3'(2'),5'-bisphosphate nucleotidase CysQ [Megalodesulfovibrio gigas]AGW13644.1 putative 3'(2'),5'-bisphosphate nucleotidase [Megalodesulfovibrio gigas DSM 1382 = ATCC 19364]
MTPTPRLDPAAVLPALKEACQTSGRLVASHYGKPVAQWTKADDSPVTEADTASHACIVAVLGRHFPGVPVLSEEGDAFPYAVRRNWDQFFLVDPLDGTKGFLRRNGDFCVAIALVQEGRSTAGCIHIPVDDVLYAGGPGLGSEMLAPGAVPVGIRTRKPAPDEGLTVLCSVTRETPKLDAYLQHTHVARRYCRGGAVKFCLLAQGDAHLFPCLYPTYEWDAAAGQAIVEGAGGAVLDLNGNPIRYNKENLINLPFVAAA